MTPATSEPNGTLEVPSSDAPEIEIWQFALTYNGYQRHGAIGDEMNRLVREFERTGSLAEELSVLRTALFFEQRRAHWLAESGPPQPTRYVTALLEKIRDLTGGSVPGPGDSPP